MQYKEVADKAGCCCDQAFFGCVQSPRVHPAPQGQMTFQEQLPSHYIHVQCTFPAGKAKALISDFYLKKKKIWENLTWKHFVTHFVPHFVHYLPQDKNTEVLWIHPGYKSDGKNLGFLLYILCGYAERILIEVSAFLMLMQIWFYFFLWLLVFFLI